MPYAIHIFDLDHTLSDFPCNDAVLNGLWRSRMLKYAPVVIGLFLLPGIFGARAQVTVDVSKITCEQFTLFKITNPRNIALWISGYVHGQRSDKIVDPQTFETNVQQLKDYCVSNPKDTVMDVVTRQTSGK